jgi:hypothetical protein
MGVVSTVYAARGFSLTEGFSIPNPNTFHVEGSWMPPIRQEAFRRLLIQRYGTGVFGSSVIRHKSTGASFSVAESKRGRRATVDRRLMAAADEIKGVLGKGTGP